MKLIFKAVDKDGKISKGFIDAKDISEGAAYLRNHDLLPIKIGHPGDQSFAKITAFLNKFSGKDLVFFTRQLASMITSGLTLMQSLSILKDQVTKDAVRDVIAGISNDIEGGSSFSVAISKYPEVFSPIYISLIKAAETSGLLDKVLLRLAENLEKQDKLKGTIKSALMYPAIVIIGMVVVVCIMMVAVVPQLAILYKGLNVEMPLPTRIIIGVSDFFVVLWPIMTGVTVIGIIAFRRWYKTESGRLIVDNSILKIPLVGKLIKESILTEITRTLALLVGAGTLVIDALNQVSGVSGNVRYKDAVLGVAKRVEKGMSVGDSMAYSPLFTPIIIQMSRIGEQTGKLDDSLMRVSEYYEREVDQTVKALLTALEPLIMVVLGVGVAFLIISIITPIYNLTAAIK